MLETGDAVYSQSERGDWAIACWQGSSSSLIALFYYFMAKIYVVATGIVVLAREFGNSIVRNSRLWFRAPLS